MCEEIREQQPTHTPTLENRTEFITVPKDAMQIDLVELLPTGGYENFVKVMEVFSW